MSITTALLMGIGIGLIVGIRIGERIERNKQARRREAGLKDITSRLTAKESA